MFYIEKIKDVRPKSSINTSQGGSDFFHEFFSEIDDKDLAKFFIRIDNNKITMDFEYDLLSIYDYLHLLVTFLNNKKIGDYFELSFYERGDDRMLFKIIDNDKVEMSYHNILQEFNKDIEIVVLINNINILVKNVVTLYLLFELNEDESNYICTWKDKIDLAQG